MIVLDADFTDDDTYFAPNNANISPKIPKMTDNEATTPTNYIVDLGDMDLDRYECHEEGVRAMANAGTVNVINYNRTPQFTNLV